LSSKKSITPWQGIPKDFSPEGLEGFVYLIVNTLSLKKYIGKKFFWSKRRKKVKGKKRRKLEVTESDWRYYESSSEALKADIRKFGKDKFTFEILSKHTTRGKTNYAETRELFRRDVLVSEDYYNDCIINRYYRGRI
jgi:hypothetical protein